MGAGSHIVGVPPIPTWPQVRAELRKIATDMVLNEKPQVKELALEELTEAQSRLQAQLDSYNAHLQRRKNEGLLH